MDVARALCKFGKLVQGGHVWARLLAHLVVVSASELESLRANCGTEFTFWQLTRLTRLANE